MTTLPSVSSLCTNHSFGITKERADKKWTRLDKSSTAGVSSFFVTIPHCSVDKEVIADVLMDAYPKIEYILVVKEIHEIHILLYSRTPIRPSTLCRKIHEKWDDRMNGLAVIYEPRCLGCTQVYLKGPVPFVRSDGSVKDFVDPEPYETGSLPKFAGKGKGGCRKEHKMEVESVRDGCYTLKRNKVEEFAEWLVKNDISNEFELKQLAGKEKIKEVLSLMAALGTNGIRESFSLTEYMKPMDTRNLIDHIDQVKGSCNCGWTGSSQEVCCNSGINWIDLGYAIYKALKDGRSKCNNIALIGPSGSGKTFLLLPLTDIFDVATITSGGSYPFIDLVDENKKVIFMNDYRCNDPRMQWQALLNLLECGVPMTVNLPQNQFKGNLRIDKNRFFAIFMTGPDRLYHHNEREMTMMDARWKYFRMTELPDCIEIKPCSKCFASWIFTARTTREGSDHLCCDEIIQGYR